jgi:hypothetical protein
VDAIVVEYPCDFFAAYPFNGLLVIQWIALIAHLSTVYLGVVVLGNVKRYIKMVT